MAADRPSESLPEESIKVEVSSNPVAGGGCGSAQIRNPATDELVMRPGASEWTLGGLPAYLFVYGPGEGIGGTSLIPGVSTVVDGFCFGIAGYFTQTVSDVQTFLQIVASFEFNL